MNEEPARVDLDLYCPLRARTMLVIDGVCFSRSRDNNCHNCIFDKDQIGVKLLWELLDLLEDKEAEARGIKQLRGVQS